MNLTFVKKSKQGSNFKILANRISECLSFMEACGINNKSVRQLSETNFYISHEALLLPMNQHLLEWIALLAIGMMYHLIWYG